MRNTIIFLFTLMLLLTCDCINCSDMYWRKGKIIEVRRTVGEGGLFGGTPTTPIKVLLDNNKIVYGEITIFTDIFTGMIAYQKYYTRDGITYLGNIRIHTGLSQAEKWALVDLNKPARLVANIRTN